MKKQYITNKAFTLVEVLVSLTIFSIIITSIIFIYITSSDLIIKSDINRKMQENLKNVSFKIADDIRKDGILSLSINKWEPYDLVVWTNKYKHATALKTVSWNKYYLAKKNLVTWNYSRVYNWSCTDIKENCVIYEHDKWPLTNSFVSVKELNFYFSKDSVNKLTISILMQPSIKKWVKIDLIKESKLIFQTTISERPF